MPVITVLGDVEPEKLGITAPHEHILLDAWSSIVEKEAPSVKTASLKKDVPNNDLYYQKVTMSNLGALKLDVAAVKDNLVLSDVDTAVEELMEFKKLGGNSVADLTNEYMGRDVLELRKISKITGLNIVTCTGYYMSDSLPESIKNKNEDELAADMIKEIEEGIGDTGIRAGVIGEIGVSREVKKEELRVLRASAGAQKETGTALYVHTWPFGIDGIRVADELESSGAIMDKVVICHVDGTINLEYCKKLLDKGVYIGFEHFGKEYREIVDGKIYIIPNDLERLVAIRDLIKLDEDYLGRIIISTDRCLKTELLKYGGQGYAHILRTIVPYMKMLDFSDDQIATLISTNPRELLTIRKIR
jgi:phosphotriesterase-related protein